MLHQPDKNTVRTSRSMLPPLSATVAGSVLVGIDSLAILGSGAATCAALIDYQDTNNLYGTATIFVWLMSLILMQFGGLYRYDAALRPLRFLLGIFVAVITAYLFLLAAAFSVKVTEDFSRLWLASFACSSVVTIAIGRICMAFLLKNLLGRGSYKRNLVIVGTGEQAVRMVASITQTSQQPIDLKGHYHDNRQDAEQHDEAPELDKSVALRGDLSDLARDARDGLIDDVVITLPWSEDQRIMAVLSKLRELPVNVYLGTDLIGYRAQFHKPPSHLGATPLYQVIGKPMSGWDAVLKQLEDYVLAFLIVVLISPLLLLIALGVWLDSGRPILFRQKRLGYNNQVFDVFKFRTMRPETEHQGKTVQATKDDPRVTRLGSFLRRWSLDELPQLFNVLNGTMSLIGPRPHALDHNDEFALRTKDYFARHRVKPGITGLAQVKGFRGSTDTDEKLEGRIRNDIFYAENWSLTMDIQILARTVIVCLFGKNAY
ncbi:MAG: undecaprenyl-phosphate glucose phosphotransferase [Anderseniella sp.]